MRATMLDHLLTPLPGDPPTGEDLSFSPEFDAIAEARRRTTAMSSTAGRR